MLINLSKLTTEQKTRKIGYRDAILYYVPETTFHKPSLCLMLIIREPHVHLILAYILKGFYSYYRSHFLNTIHS